MPALQPKPTKASTKHTEPRIGPKSWARKVENSKEPVWAAMMRKPIMMPMKPMWAMTRYRKPPRMEAGFCSMMTRKYEERLMSSKNTRNQKALSTVRTRFMEAMNAFMKKPMAPRPMPLYSSKYEMP